MVSIYKQLIYETDIYPPDVVRKYGEDSIHWHPHATWLNCELSLRHDYCCHLLCNLELMPKETEGPPPKRMRLGGTSHDSDDSLDDMFYDADMIDEPIEEGDMDLAIEVLDMANRTDPDALLDEDEYRIICLEGRVDIEHLQNLHARRLGMEPPTSKWDLFDKHLGKFIEVKVTMSYDRAVIDYQYKSQDMGEHASLCWINSENGAIIWMDHPGGLKGEHLVTKFLVNRRTKMLELGITFAEAVDETLPANDILSSPYINDLLLAWETEITANRNEALPTNYAAPASYNPNGPQEFPNPIGIKDILDKLDDPRNIGGEIVQWKPRLLPPYWFSEPIWTMETGDKEMCHLFLQRVETTLVDPIVNDIPGYEVLTQTLQWWKQIQGRNWNYTFILPKEQKLPEISALLDYLGVGRKEYVFTDMEGEYAQPEYKEPLRKKYHPYFDNIMYDLGSNTERGCWFGMFEKEKKHIFSEHPIDVATAKFEKEFMGIVEGTNIAEYMSAVINLYSRLGGSYAPPGSTSKRHGNCVCFPIYSVERTPGADEVTNEPDVLRKVMGITLRGPHHAKQATDKVNLVMIEMFEWPPHNPAVEVYLKYSNRKMVCRTQNHAFFVTQTAINRQDPSYITFVQNSLFSSANMIGEIILNNMIGGGMEQLNARIENYLTEYGRWCVARVVEAVMMAISGTSQEEGGLSGIRKLILIFISLLRGNATYHLDIQALCDDINECLIDKPLIMHFVTSIHEVFGEIVDNAMVAPDFLGGLDPTQG